ncbi:type II secretion system F family protein [Nocardioides litoris]|uniref:type II secretion system F family protein n=1 Tax=Nocardioides litoris TaxID=1926648 RepID=UPI00111FD9C8|nr:type II secretion system F family protein [Nocardioides litoris]
MAAATLTKFEFTAKDKSGKLVEGKVDAENEAVLREKLLAMGALPLDIRVVNAGMQKEITLGLPKRVKLKDLAVFSRQFATMLSAGLPLIRCLSILAEQTENDELARVLRLVKTDIEEGNPLSRALERHPKAFPPLMVNMVKAGEVGGFLDQTMLQIAEAFEADVKLRGKIKAALTYPVVIFILAILMCVGMLLFIVPVFEKMFSSLGGELPLPTRVLVALSAGLKTGAPFIAVGMVGALVWWRKNAHKPAVRNVVDPLKLRLPVFGNLFQKVAIARFTRNFGTLLRSGVPLLQALDIVAETTGSVVISRALRDVQDSVRQGESIHKPLAEHEVFPPMVVQMVAVGEDTGAIDEMLGKIAEFYDEEVESTTEQLTALIEPLMIAFLGGVVGSMIIALYMPIFKVFDLIS